MQEVFEKIIEKLEELQNYACFPTEWVNEEQSKIHSYYANKLTEILKLTEQYDNGWIPVEYHEITDEEREEGFISEDITYFPDCKLPEDGEEILITRKWRDEYIVEHDMCIVDDGYFLESSLDWIDVIAWQPLPQPYQPKGE